jgi:hypothetical protein
MKIGNTYKLISRTTGLVLYGEFVMSAFGADFAKIIYPELCPFVCENILENYKVDLEYNDSGFVGSTAIKKEDLEEFGDDLDELVYHYSEYFEEKVWRDFPMSDIAMFRNLRPVPEKTNDYNFWGKELKGWTHEYNRVLFMKGGRWDFNEAWLYVEDTVCGSTDAEVFDVFTLP